MQLLSFRTGRGRVFPGGSQSGTRFLEAHQIGFDQEAGGFDPLLEMMRVDRLGAHDP
jgi:hypothetical protein